MNRKSVLALLWLAFAPSTILHGQVPPRFPSPPPFGAKPPQLSSITEKQVRPILATLQHCELKVGDKLQLVATEQGRYAVAVLNGAISVLPFDGSGPVRNGGRFLGSSPTLDIWISVQRSEDQSLARGIPRHASIMVNGSNGGSDVYSGLYTCNY